MPDTLAKQFAASGGQVGRRTAFPELAAASGRAPIKAEIRSLAVTTSSVLHHVPDGDAASRGTPDIRNRWVNFQAVGGDVYIAFGNDSDTALTVDQAARSVQTGSVVVGSVTATRITAHASNNEAWHIPSGTWLPIPVGNPLVMAIKGSAVCVLNFHPSET